MMYKNCKEWIKANTLDAHTIIKLKISEDDGKEALEDTLVWCEYEIEKSHKIISWLDKAIKEVCNEEQYQKIQELYALYMRNNFTQELKEMEKLWNE